jgi:Pyrimidine dimer DNA glycosylase/2-cysteine adaptor domain
MVVTFVTSSHPSCVAVLDSRRLNKQRVEAQQILDVLLSGGKRNHPAIHMWRGHTDALKVYINYCIREWRARGGACKLDEYEIEEDEVEFPWWFAWRPLYVSHRCSLIRKDPEYYTDKLRLKKSEKVWLDHGYVWPSKLKNIDITRKYSPEEVCVPIGSGAPAQYRWSVEEVRKWKKDKLVNPRTGRAIKKDAKTGLYKDIEKAYNHYVSSGLI